MLSDWGVGSRSIYFLRSAKIFLVQLSIVDAASHSICSEVINLEWMLFWVDAVWPPPPKSNSIYSAVWPKGGGGGNSKPFVSKRGHRRVDPRSEKLVCLWSWTLRIRLEIFHLPVSTCMKGHNWPVKKEAGDPTQWHMNKKWRINFLKTPPRSISNSVSSKPNQTDRKKAISSSMFVVNTWWKNSSDGVCWWWTRPLTLSGCWSKRCSATSASSGCSPSSSSLFTMHKWSTTCVNTTRTPVSANTCFSPPQSTKGKGVRQQRTQPTITPRISFFATHTTILCFPSSCQGQTSQDKVRASYICLCSSRVTLKIRAVVFFKLNPFSKKPRYLLICVCHESTLHLGPGVLTSRRCVFTKWNNETSKRFFFRIHSPSPAKKDQHADSMESSPECALTRWCHPTLNVAWHHICWVPPPPNDQTFHVWWHQILCVANATWGGGGHPTLKNLDVTWYTCRCRLPSPLPQSPDVYCVVAGGAGGACVCLKRYWNQIRKRRNNTLRLRRLSQ